MNKLKLILTMALTFTVLFAQVGSATAAPLAQTPTDLTGTVQTITIGTTNGVTTVTVTLKDAQNVMQTVHISVATAASLGLLVVDPITKQPVIDPTTNLPTPVDVTTLTQPITITGSTIIPDTTNTAVNPISTLLAVFFNADASAIDKLHNEDGFGFGLIAQALWMSRNLTHTEVGDVSLAGDILQAKKDKDFATFFKNHPEITFDGTPPTNWGQFRKVFLDKKNNLGVVVSGHGNNPDNSSQQPGNGQNHGKDNNNGKGNDHNKP